MARSLFLLLCLLLSFLISATAHGLHDDDDEPTAAADDAPPNLRSGALIAVKMWCLVIVFVSTLLGGLSPYFFRWNEGFLVLGTQFAGGVFLGTAMMHFLSDANETFGELTTVEYPFAFLLACGGYLLTMVADCVIRRVYGKHQSGGDLEAQGNLEQGKDNSHNIQVSNGKDATHFEHSLFTTVTSLGDSILLIVALCFHSVFEGIAIGIAETKADAWRALWTISLHKIFAAIAMGIALLRMIPDRPFMSCAAYAFAFAVSSPVGVAIGITIDAVTQGAVADWIFAISMGVACGVFIYVSINHLISKGYIPQTPVSLDTPLLKFVAVLLGIGVIAVVMIWDT